MEEPKETLVPIRHTTNKYFYTFLGLAMGSNKAKVPGRMVSEAEPSSVKDTVSNHWPSQCNVLVRATGS
jgi:hypothetical protein